MFFNIRLIPVKKAIECSVYYFGDVAHYVSDIDSKSQLYEIFREAIKQLSIYEITEVIAQIKENPKEETFNFGSLHEYISASHMIFRSANENFEAFTEYEHQPLLIDSILRVFMLLLLKYEKQFRQSKQSRIDKTYVCIVCGRTQDGNSFPAGNMSACSTVHTPPHYCRYKNCASHILLPMINPDYKVSDKYFDTAPTTSIALERAFQKNLLNPSKKDI